MTRDYLGQAKAMYRHARDEYRRGVRDNNELAIRELGKTVTAIKKKNLVDRYMAREQTLHEMCFYEEIYDRSILEKNFDKVKKYIADVEQVADGNLTGNKS